MVLPVGYLKMILNLPEIGDKYQLWAGAIKYPIFSLTDERIIFQDEKWTSMKQFVNHMTQGGKVIKNKHNS